MEITEILIEHAYSIICEKSQAKRNVEKRIYKLIDDLKSFIIDLNNHNLKARTSLCYVGTDSNHNPKITGCRSWKFENEYLKGLNSTDYDFEYTGTHGNYRGYFVGSKLLEKRYGYTYIQMLELGVRAGLLIRSDHYNAPIKEETDEPIYSKVLILTTLGLNFAGIKTEIEIEDYQKNLWKTQLSSVKIAKENKQSNLGEVLKPILDKYRMKKEEQPEAKETISEEGEKELDDIVNELSRPNTEEELDRFDKNEFRKPAEWYESDLRTGKSKSDLVHQFKREKYQKRKAM